MIGHPALDVLHSFSLLLIEDEKKIKSEFVDSLQSCFREIYTASSAKEAMKIFNERTPALVVCSMSLMESSKSLTKVIKARLDEDMLLVVIVDEEKHPLEAIKMGADSLILRPLDERRLLRVISKAIGKFHETRNRVDSREQDAIFFVVADHSPIGICMVGEEGILYGNDSVREILGCGDGDLLGRNLNDFFDKESHLPERSHHEQGKQQYCQKKEGEATLKLQNGKRRYIHWAANAIDFRGQSVCVFNIIDVTEKHELEEKFEQNRKQLVALNSELQASLEVIQQKNALLETRLYMDLLTNKPNRRKLLEDLEKQTEPVLMILVNIDSFKEINDFYGARIGDLVIQDLARRLQNFINEKAQEYKLYKLQADEYAIVCFNYKSNRPLEYVGKELQEAIDNHTVMVEEQELHVQISIGLSLSDQESSLAHTDVALKLAKSEHQPFVVYNDKMMVLKRYEENFHWVRTLKSASGEGRIISYFQPIMDNRTGKVLKYECLARLVGDDGRVYSPFFFIEASKKARLYHKITKAIVSDACQVFQSVDASFGINLSIDDIADETTVEYITSELQRYGVAKKVIFEILESEGINNYEVVSAFIHKVRILGCKIAIDDFGSGYSNFSHIFQLNVDILKIDSSIIQNCDTDENSRVILQAIVDFAKKLQLETVAEFVHNRSVLDAVRSFDIDYSQGFFIGEPRRELLPDSFELAT